MFIVTAYGKMTTLNCHQDVLVRSFLCELFLELKHQHLAVPFHCLVSASVTGTFVDDPLSFCHPAHALLLFPASAIRVPYTGLAGGDPLGYFDWSMILQATLNGLESAALFGAASIAIEAATRKGLISRFPG